MDLLQDYLTAYLPLPIRLLLSPFLSSRSTSTTSTSAFTSALADTPLAPLANLAPLLQQYIPTPLAPLLQPYNHLLGYIPTPLLALLSPLLQLLTRITALLPALVARAPALTELNFTTVAVGLVVLVLGLKMLGVVGRMVVYWVGMLVRVGVWGVVGVGVVWVWLNWGEGTGQGQGQRWEGVRGGQMDGGRGRGWGR